MSERTIASAPLLTASSAAAQSSWTAAARPLGPSEILYSVETVDT